MRLAPLFIVACLASIGSLRLAGADPTAGRVITAPTAWLPPAGAVIGTGTLDHRFDGSAVVGVGLGGLAALDVGTDTDVRGCVTCDGDAAPIYLGRASFRLGAPQNSLFAGMPALVVGVRTTFASSGSFGRARVSEAYLVASRELGPVRLHTGAMMFDASLGDDLTLGNTVRPFGAIEWTPGLYPKTTVMTDVAYVPLLRATQIPSPSIDTEWVFGWGVRYQAFEWGAIDLAVRHRENEGLGDSTVMVRVNGVLDPRRLRR